MRIVIDARLYGPRHGGLGRYIQQLILRLPTLSANNEWLWLMGDQAAVDYRRDVGNVPSNVKIVAAPWQWYTMAEQWHLPPLIRALNPDLTHYPHFNVPLSSPRPFIVTIHDLIINHFPSSRATTLLPLVYSFKLAAYRYLVRQAAKHSCKIIVPTQFGKDDLINQYPSLDSNKIIMTYEGVTMPPSTKSDPQTVLLKYGIESPFLLYVGSAYPHKDVLTALRAFKQLKQQGIVKHLVHVWRSDEFLTRLQNQARREDLTKGVVWSGFVPDDDLSVLYRTAAAYIFPSLYEGFGLPPLEAQAAGCPVIAAQSSCLPEVLGSSVAWFEPKNTEQLVGVVKKVIADQAYRRDLINLGQKNITRFSWDTMVKQTLNIYHDSKNLSA